MNKLDAIMSYVALAYKAGKVMIGTEGCIDALQKHKAQYIILAHDASTRTQDDIDKKAFFYHIPVNKDYGSSDIEHALGRNTCKVVTIIDKGFADAIAKAIEKKVKDMEEMRHGS